MSMPINLQVDHSAPLPLASQISEQLRWLIQSGLLSEGDELPSAVDLARDLQVNFHTVRAAYQHLRDQKLVSMGRGRRTTVRDVDRIQQQWPQTRVPTHTIGVLIPEFVQQYSQLIVGVESEAALQPTLVYVANAHESSTKALTYLDRFLAKGVDGIIIAAALLDPATDIPSNGPPIVFIDSPGAPAPSVVFNLEKAQFLATGHLAEHGHEQIGYITPPTSLANIGPKLAGHHKALQKAGLDYNPDLTVQVDDFTHASGQAAATELLSRINPPTAITTTSDQLAFGIYAAARHLGKSIPEDVAITSNDNTDTAELVHPTLTTTTLPLQQAGRVAVQQIQKVRSGEPTPREIKLDVGLATRQSCGHHTPRT